MEFYKSITENYHQIFPLNKMQVTFVCSSFTETKDLKLLDIGCGIGELSFELSKHFKNIHAIDLDESMIKKARQNFGKKASNILFHELNMLDIEKTYGAHTFDAIICFGNTLVHLEGSMQILNFFRQVRKVLKKDGKLLFQIINYDRIIDQNIKALPTIENDDIKFIRNYKLNADHKKLDFNTMLTVKRTGKIVENNVRLYPLRKEEVNSLLIEAGFKKVKHYGNFKRDDLIAESIPLIIEAN